MSDINDDILHFAALSRLGDHRVGMLLASNGKLVERARNGGRHYQETVSMIRDNLQRQIELRDLDPTGFKFRGHQ